MTPETVTAAPSPSPDSLAKIAEAIGPWGFVACVALLVLWKLGTKYLDVQAERKELENEALKELKDALNVLKRDYEQDRELFVHRMDRTDLRVGALCDSAAGRRPNQRHRGGRTLHGVDDFDLPVDFEPDDD